MLRGLALLLVALGASACSSRSGPTHRTPVAGAVHEVRRGETLWSIAREHGSSVAALQQANGLAPDRRIVPGQRLVIPGALRVHKVRRGDTLWSIAQRYDSTVEAIGRANGIGDATQLAVGQRLRVPTGIRRAARAGGSAKTWTSRDARARSASPGQFSWPVKGRLTSRFGRRGGAHHDGLDISAPRGTPVRAAAAGRVIHADASLAGYGKMIIVKHSDRYSTVYAHNRRMLVRVGQFVDKGQVIAEVGKTGRASAPHLHFEIRYDGRARDPLGFLE
jgi:murein DD-endopeptidase MepM/ murein hydrolase activator NlpD